MIFGNTLIIRLQQVGLTNLSENDNHKIHSVSSENENFPYDSSFFTQKRINKIKLLAKIAFKLQSLGTYLNTVTADQKR